MSVTECPICMEAIEGANNRVVTECGHAFHCSCLMKNAAHNGFGCPYCRAVMAEVPEDEEDEDYDDEETLFEEDALTSFRMFHQRIEGEEVEEEEAEEWETINSNEEEDDEELPDVEYVCQKLIERGVTFEDLVKTELYQEHRVDIYEQKANAMYGMIRSIITRYEPEIQNTTSTAIVDQVTTTAIQEMV